MEGSSFSQPSDSNHPTASGASKFLADLPSLGFFSSTVVSSNPGGMRVYICDHDTSPPEDQQIKTNQQNILIRSLMLRRQKGDSSSKDVKGVTATEGSRKRVAERAPDSRTSAKRANSQISSRQEGSNSQASSRDFQSFTVERLQSFTVEKLRALLKARGLSLRGKKDELITRLKGTTA
ncbi:uncharacterized protein LOC121233982 [Juglans microcarpa x Juglans regia]|uniref:uncharacterized protein LOC121233982 n=1 Tax=Juglans microcarpa x Juglans regia TaxID=2249226 RepID=UPI001B7EDDC3|nr:uncharacterized protein LOC121233982 [Juglans microcarpa x Juglans regia]